MTCIAQKQIQKIAALAIAVLMLGGSASLFAQISPISDYQYKKDFPQYDAIKKEADAQKRADALLGFIKARPVSKILPFAAADYLACVQPLLAQKDWTKAIAMEEALLAALPTPEVAKAAIPEGVTPGFDDFMKEQLVPAQKSIYQALLTTYYQSQNLPKAAETAEKLYAISPDKGVLDLLASINLGMKNYDKYLEYAQKIMADTPMDQGYTVALQMAQVYIQKQNVAKATELLAKIMEVYGDKVPPNVPEAQWKATRAFAYGVIASGIYSAKDYAKAIELYGKVAANDPTREDAHYYIGMSRWQTKDPEGAIEAFSRCVVLNKTLAKKAQGYLEDLYKARHSGNLDGLDQVLAKAKADLGVN